MKFSRILKGKVHCHNLPLLNFFYLSMIDQTNIWYTGGFVVSLFFLTILNIGKEHTVNKAIETGRTSFDEMYQDVTKDWANIIVSFPLYILFWGSFIHIATMNMWISPYTHSVLLINVVGLATQVGNAIYKRQVVINHSIKPAYEKYKRGKQSKKK